MTTSADKPISVLIKEKAADLGFDLCGIAPSDILVEQESVLRGWCSAGMNGDMGYLERDIEKRINPGQLFPGAKSVIVTGLNYYTSKKQRGVGVPLISKYAYGIDYHDVIKEMLSELLSFIKVLSPETEGKICVDSAPLLEKAWAQKAGLGWPGRHSILVNDKIGSYFFLGVLVVNSKMEYDLPSGEDHCGNCRLCIDSCPACAINNNRTIDARKCISYLTTVSKSPVPEELVPELKGMVFGCDICQDVCPWNKNAQQHKIPEFELPEKIEIMNSNEWIRLSEEQFKVLFRRSPIARRKYHLFRENVTNVTKFNG
jgi:epoxyqueuosine reductase